MENIGILLEFFFLNEMKKRLKIKREREGDQWNRFTEREQREEYI